MKVKKIILSFITIIFLFGIIYQYTATIIDRNKYPPLGKLIDIGGYRLHIYCTEENKPKENKPTVILESGFGCDCLEWSLVQPEIAKFAKVCSYDRAGYGWSDKSTYPRNFNQIVKELHTLLINAKISPPYIFVGHSLGGAIIQYFSKKYPDEIFGLILVDSCHEKQNEILPLEPKKTLKEKFFSSATYRLTLNRLGISRFIKQLPKHKKTYKEFFKIFPEQIQNMILANQNDTKQIKAILQEEKSFAESWTQLKEIKPFFEDKPLIVISAGKAINTKGMPDDKVKYFQQLHKSFHLMQKDLASRSSKGKLIIAEKSDHLIPFHQPKIIVEAVKQIIEEAN